jgi:cation:H+ antiporter
MDLVDILLAAVGLVLLFGGGEMLLRGAVALARHSGVSELAIGLTVVGFATSMPELLVSVDAALRGRPGIAVGNVIGSNIANVLLIAGVSAVVLPITGWERTVRRDALVMVGASLLLLGAAFHGSIPLWAGIVMLALLVCYIVFTYRMSLVEMASKSACGTKADPEGAIDHAAAAGAPLWRSAGFLAGGFAMLFFGADWLVEGATGIARAVGVSEAVIGLTVVAVGTSLPELATSLTAAYRGNPAVALGNIVGSNVFNILAILGITALVAPLAVAERFIGFDIPLMIGVALLLTFMLIARDEIGRGAGAAMLIAYAAYTVHLFAGAN